MSERNTTLSGKGISSKIIDILIIIILSLGAFITIFPIYNVLIISMARYEDILQNPLYLIPKAIDFRPTSFYSWIGFYPTLF